MTPHQHLASLCYRLLDEGCPSTKALSQAQWVLSLPNDLSPFDVATHAAQLLNSISEWRGPLASNVRGHLRLCMLKAFLTSTKPL